ncbi:MAG: hypothetical protein LV481_11715 [Methylacidiphilales bacterium]|nr:hypothetical protein [Candidatus Methylacidiphilales bacterium]
MKKAMCALVVASLISTIGWLWHFFSFVWWALKLRAQLPQDVTTTEWGSFIYPFIYSNLIGGLWYFVITVLLVFAIWSLKRAN